MLNKCIVLELFARLEGHKIFRVSARAKIHVSLDEHTSLTHIYTLSIHIIRCHTHITV